MIIMEEQVSHHQTRLSSSKDASLVVVSRMLLVHNFSLLDKIGWTYAINGSQHCVDLFLLTVLTTTWF